MYEVIYLKADYEPWWMFDGWEDEIQSRETFHDYNEAKNYLYTLLSSLRKQCEHEEMRKKCFYAFWSTDEKVFCDGCDEDLQVYHGVILMKDGQPHLFLGE